jgi:hypothetical protein
VKGRPFFHTDRASLHTRRPSCNTREASVNTERPFCRKERSSRNTGEAFCCTERPFLHNGKPSFATGTNIFFAFGFAVRKQNRVEERLSASQEEN